MVKFPKKSFRRALKGCIFCMTAFGASACTPYYTWGYAKSIHPRATQAYILAVMARESGDYESSLNHYDEALRYTYSENVAKERSETALLLEKTRQ